MSGMTQRRASVAHVAVADPARRQPIVEALRERGIAVVEQPTGFHVVQAIADLVEGRADEVPSLIVVDEVARGCSGISIRDGLRALGYQVPLAVVSRSGALCIEGEDRAQDLLPSLAS